MLTTIRLGSDRDEIVRSSVCFRPKAEFTIFINLTLVSLNFRSDAVLQSAARTIREQKVPRSHLRRGHLGERLNEGSEERRKNYHVGMAAQRNRHRSLSGCPSQCGGFGRCPNQNWGLSVLAMDIPERVRHSAVLRRRDADLLALPEK